MFIALLFIIAKMLKQSNWWMHKQSLIYSYMEYYSATKWNEVLVHIIAQMHLETLMLNEKAKHKRLRVAWFRVYEMAIKANPLRQEVDEWLPVAGGRENGCWLLTFMDFFWGWWKCSGIRGSWWLYNLANILEITECIIWRGRLHGIWIIP